MSAFKTALEFRDNGGFPFELISPLVYESDCLKREVHVPATFKTDLASIPWILWRVLPKVGKYDKAAVVHDYLYWTNGVTRAQADQVLYEAMSILGVNSVQKRAIYAGVRVGGWRPWNTYRKEQATWL